jgi:proton-translocating NADH-quinone oxidoreductase chain M
MSLRTFSTHINITREQRRGITKFIIREINQKLEATLGLNNNIFYRGLHYCRLSTWYNRYVEHYLFWCFYLGWPYLFLGLVFQGQVFFIPNLWFFVSLTAFFGIISFTFWSFQASTQFGIIALWSSLVTLTLLGTACVSQIVFNVDFLVGPFVLDTLSVPFVLLTLTLTPPVIVASLDSVRGDQLQYYWLLLFLITGVTCCFCLSDFLTFYILFEILGFPMFVLIGVYGPRAQRLSAAYKFFGYTFVGSAFILPVLVYLYFEIGSTQSVVLLDYQFTEIEQALFVGLTVFPFAVKVPVMPLHLWLPEAHVEAPTPVSMLLAALLLKTGGYAIFRFILPVWNFGVYVWSPFFITIALVSVLWGSLYALIQVDTKRMIAYASVAHMSLVFLGCWVHEGMALYGGVFLMIAHGYISAGLFAGIGVLYDRYHTRTIRYLGGIAGCMPLFGILFFLLTLGNFSFPFTGGFTGEFLLLLGICFGNPAVAIAASSTVFLSLCYSVWLYNRVFYGDVSFQVVAHQDLTRLEVAVLGWCAFFVVVLGFCGGAWTGYAGFVYEWLSNSRCLL